MLDIVCHSYMNTSYKLILIYLSEVSEFKGSQKELGKALGMSEMTVHKGLKFLKDEGFISSEPYYTNKTDVRAGSRIRYLGI